MADIRDVARSAGVSIATVSRVFSGSSVVSGTARAAVLDAATALRYQPDARARSLRTRRSLSIGLLVGDILNPFFTELARAVEAEAHRHGYLVIIGNSTEDPQVQDDYLKNLLENQVDALIIAPTREPSPSLRATLEGHPAAVIVDRELPGLPCIGVDGRPAIEELARVLSGHGYRRPAVISGPVGISTGRARLDQFAAACRREGLDLAPERIIKGDFQPDSGRTGMRTLLATNPDCVFIADNLMALGALDELAESAVAYPADLGLAVYDDVPWFRHTVAPMTVISQPVRELGRRAVHAALGRLGVVVGPGGTRATAPEMAAGTATQPGPQAKLTATLIQRGSLQPQATVPQTLAAGQAAPTAQASTTAEASTAHQRATTSRKRNHNAG